jgi:hypothetical protein
VESELVLNNLIFSLLSREFLTSSWYLTKTAFVANLSTNLSCLRRNIVEVIVFGIKVNLSKYPFEPLQNGIGGEGEVFVHKTNPDFIIKILHNPNLKKLQKIHFCISKELWKIPNISFPQSLVTDLKGNIIGYVAKRFVGFHSLATCGNSTKTQTQAKILLKLHRELSSLHISNIVIGDFNGKNFLVKNEEIALIDTDAWGYNGTEPCASLTSNLPVEFVNPISKKTCKSLTTESDWYGFTLLVFNVLFGYDAFEVANATTFGRVFSSLEAKSKYVCFLNPANTLASKTGLIQKFHSTLLKYFIEVFECGKRGEFPRKLLEPLVRLNYNQYVFLDSNAKHLLFQNYPGTKIGGNTTTVNKVTPVVTPIVQPIKVPIRIPQQYVPPKTIATKPAKIPRPVKKPTPIVSSSFQKNYTPSVNQAKSVSSKAPSPKIAIQNILSQFGSIHTWKTKHQVLIWSCMFIGLMVSIMTLPNDIKWIMSTMNNMIEKSQEIKSNEKK